MSEELPVEVLASNIVAYGKGVEHADDPGVQVETLAEILRIAARAQDAAVWRMLDQGATWVEVGRRVGISKQAAQQRFSGR